MGKISKYSNLYKGNTLIRSVNSKGVLEKYTLKEVQDLVDKLGTEKDENGRIKDQEGFNNASYILMQMYNDPKYNDEKENFIKELNDRLQVNKEEVGRSLDELDKGLQQGETNESSDTNSEREAVQVSGEDGDNKGRKTGDDAIKFNLNGQEVTMSKTDIEKDKEMSKGAFLKSYDVNDNKEEYVEYKEN
jgi:hypothetical protein|nr:MAG TPA: hypothetical protein [Bacteriophage sp.]